MSHFGIRFLILHLLTGILILVLLATKRLLGKHLSPRLQYNLWFLLLAMQAVPFLPSSFTDLAGLLPRWMPLNLFTSQKSADFRTTLAATAPVSAGDWMNDFTLSVSSQIPPLWSRLIFLLWFTGGLILTLRFVRSRIALYHLTRSALPLQNRDIRKLFASCKARSKIHRHIPLYSSAFLKSPFTIGFIRPKIYIPVHLISDFNETELGYMLLHELQHCRYMDGLVNHLMNLSRLFYWPNPLVWYALKEMKADREIACDSSVLQLLTESEYIDYANTLINFAEKLSRNSFPFVSGIGGNVKQIRKRILNIVSYRSPSSLQKLKGCFLYVLIAAWIFHLTPVLSIHAAEADVYHFSGNSISLENFDSFFEGGSGSFVLYDARRDHWQIYNPDQAVQRVSPDSTWKIYNALLGLESGIITPETSQMTWNGEIYPFDAWNRNQTLDSAIKNSVNWYFHRIDLQSGKQAVQSFVQKLHYGNMNVNGSFPSYWLESSLKISAVEQVELLRNFHDNHFQFKTENIRAVKDALQISVTPAGAFYGKTGTGQVDGKNINGWFIGFLETPDTTYYFATNLREDSDATGSKAAEITKSILSELKILPKEGGDKEMSPPSGVSIQSLIPPSPGFQ